ncbi:tannase and feruloyl esterase [Daldinia caldariorum]|uniref:tannase and feruloyl esterase n=1 Tax=Daldinia caldariorum TaxID=326644 RepID=UPI0020073EE7|nr:tannase and feruloyl esterase [Daldinia caldariorum]KAI1469644.1 tannase and feruloyl esterase [Daldinia caldariorum]
MALASLADGCVPSTFSPVVFGAEILSVSVSLVTNYSLDIPDGLMLTAPSPKVRDAKFCNVTVTYTHPGYGDNINVETWLPIDNWNGRLQSLGGGGWVAGRFELSYLGVAGAMFTGYAASTTDAGLGYASDPDLWALTSPGNVNWYLLEDFTSRSLNDQAIIAKSLVESFYGRPPSYSYWNGCSQGGRQGLMLAQRYPNAYNGISAGAPGIYWTNTMLNSFWPEHVMRTMKEYPNGCELDAITAAAVSKCDGLDGVVDGIVQNVDECREHFNPFDLVDTTIDCGNTTAKITTAAAQVANATWTGITSSTGENLWPGLTISADLTCHLPRSAGQVCLATTDCTNGTCTVDHPTPFGWRWLSLFVAKDPNFNSSNITNDELVALLKASRSQYSSIDTSDPDLSEFKKAGGKIVSYHGLADNIIPPKSTEKYYEAVSNTVENVEDFFRLFETPGLGHCFGGLGQPDSLFGQLQAWVEEGIAPDSSPISFNNSNGETQHRIICPWPQKAQYNSSCGNSAKAECWSCVESSAKTEVRREGL